MFSFPRYSILYVAGFLVNIIYSSHFSSVNWIVAFLELTILFANSHFIPVFEFSFNTFNELFIHKSDKKSFLTATIDFLQYILF